MSSTLTATKSLSWHPTGADFRFAIKLVGGALLALFAAFIADLPQPHWAMMTALILFQPLAGMVLSRAVARLAGSIVGVCMGLLLVTLFAQAPPLLVAAAALWLGVCTFGTGMFAGNAGYVCVLAGYSAALVSFPGAQHPEQVFDMAWARCAEIGLGIVCASLTQLSLWPRTASSALIPQAQETNEEARSGAATALEAAERSANPATCRAFNSVLSLNALLGHSRYELETGPAVRRSLRALLVNLLRLQAASRSAAGFWQRLPDSHPLQPLRQQAAAALHLPASAAKRQRLARTAHQLQQLAHNLADNGRADDLNAYAALTRTAATLRYARDGDRLLRMAVRAPETNPAHAIEPPLANHRDPILAAFNGLRSSLTLGLVGSFWIVTGWSDGTGAAIIAAIVCSVFASWPNPARAGGLFLWGIGCAALAALLLHQWLLPAVNSFAMLALCLIPFLSAGALVMNQPGIAGAGVAFTMSLCTLLAPSNPMQYDLAALLNGFLANGFLANGFGAVVATLSYLVLAPPALPGCAGGCINKPVATAACCYSVVSKAPPWPGSAADWRSGSTRS